MTKNLVIIPYGFRAGTPRIERGLDALACFQVTYDRKSEAHFLSLKNN